MGAVLLHRLARLGLRMLVAIGRRNSIAQSLGSEALEGTDARPRDVYYLNFPNNIEQFTAISVRLFTLWLSTDRS